METWDEPTDIGRVVLNLRAECVARKVIDHDGRLLDLEGFMVALVSTVKKSIVVKDLDEYRRLREEEKLAQPILTRIVVYVACGDGVSTAASLRRNKLPEEADICTYVAQRQGDDVRLVGDPPLDDAQQRQLFESLAHDVAAAQIFDDEAPVVAAALRAALERH
jgi:hypothetical protein